MRVTKGRILIVYASMGLQPFLPRILIEKSPNWERSGIAAAVVMFLVETVEASFLVRRASTLNSSLSFNIKDIRLAIIRISYLFNLYSLDET